MATLNKVMLIGNLTRDPEVRYAPSGDAVGGLGLAVSRKFRTRDGQDREETCFVDIDVWGRQAETCGQYLTKGSPVFVEGRLQFHQWEKDGQKHSKLRVRADRVQFLGRGRSDAAGGGTPPGSGTAAPNAAPEPMAGNEPDTTAPYSNDSGDDDNLPF